MTSGNLIPLEIQLSRYRESQTEREEAKCIHQIRAYSKHTQRTPILTRGYNLYSRVV
jgi:hypothetical protein